MGGIIIHGWSDDIIYVKGDVQKELYANFNKPTFLTVEPYGATVKVVYDTDGVWRFEAAGPKTGEKFQLIEQGDFAEVEYSEALRIVGDDLDVVKT